MPPVSHMSWKEKFAKLQFRRILLIEDFIISPGHFSPLNVLIDEVFFCIFAGHDTKALLNNRGPRYKRSKLERQINRDVIWCVVLLILLCCGGAIGEWRHRTLTSWRHRALLSWLHFGIKLNPTDQSCSRDTFYFVIRQKAHFRWNIRQRFLNMQLETSDAWEFGLTHFEISWLWFGQT